MPPTSERIEFFKLTACALDELLQGKSSNGVHFFTCNPQQAAQGSLTVNHSSNIGVGTFKSAHRGHLTLIHLPIEGLGTTPNALVAAKRLYRKRARKANSDAWVLSRHSAADEYAKTLQEANLLYWGCSLMTFTYSFIHHFVAQAEEEPPFTIPDLRFVHAGVAVVHDQTVGTNVNNTSSMRRTYLLEEFIDTSQEEFVKFVHNGEAVPHLSSNDPLYEIAELICFTHLVQYFKTGGAVFLSDLQGQFPYLVF